MTQRDKILVVSHDPRLADVRRAVLESAGFEVISVTDSQTTWKDVCGAPFEIGDAGTFLVAGGETACVGGSAGALCHSHS